MRYNLKITAMGIVIILESTADMLLKALRMDFFPSSHYALLC